MRTAIPADRQPAPRSRPAPVVSSSELDADGVRSLQRTAGNAAVSALLGTRRSGRGPGGATRALQRNHESAALLKELAQPKVLEFKPEEIDVQKEIVDKFEAAIGVQKERPREARRAAKEQQAKLDDLMERYQRFMVEDAPEMTEEEDQTFNAELKAIGTPPDPDVELSTYNRWSVSVLPIGAIELTSLPESDDDLLREAKLIDLPSNSLKQGSAFDLVEQTGMQNNVVKNTLNTMIKAGQVDYLRKAGVIGDDWKVLIEIHYYRSRDQTTSQFHKDTLGQTLFVNLNYHIDQPVTGPEYLLHPATVPEHERQIEETLPPEFRKDLASAREGAEEATHAEAPDIPAYGAVAFVDELIHHMTPLRGHRAVTGADLAKYLDKYHSEYVEGESPPKATLETWREMSQRRTATYTRPDFGDAGMSRKEINRLLTEFGPSGWQTVSIPQATSEVGGTVPIVRTSKKPLKRRMSWKATRGQLLEPVKGERRFFRTWVRAIRKT